MMSVQTRRYIKIVISFLLIAGLFYISDTRAMAESLRRVKPGYLALALCMVFCNRVLMPVKWNLLLRASGIRLRHWTAIRIYTVASFTGLFLPPTVGADGVRSYYLRKAGIRLSDALASIFIERVFGLLILLVFTLAGFFLLTEELRDGAIDVATFTFVLIAIAVTSLAAVFISFMPVTRRAAERFAGKLQNTRFSPLARGAGEFIRAYQEYRGRKTILIVFCALTALELTLVILRSHVVAFALGVELPLAVFFGFLPLVTLLNRMPISFDGFGINEAMFVYFLRLFGVTAGAGFLIGLLNHLIFIIGVLPGAIFYVYWDRHRDEPVPTESQAVVSGRSKT